MPVPPGVVTVTAPLAPVTLTAAVIVVALLTVNDVTATPPKLTPVAPVKLLPLIVITAPAAPAVGEKELMTGVGINVKPDWLAVQPAVVTLTVPFAPLPTIAVI